MSTVGAPAYYRGFLLGADVDVPIFDRTVLLSTPGIPGSRTLVRFASAASLDSSATISLGRWNIARAVWISDPIAYERPRSSAVIMESSPAYATVLSQRFELALRSLEPEGWIQFEKLTGQFLGDEFSDYRTKASTSGDGGRDGVVVAPGGEETVAIQASVQADWEDKIRQTVTRLATTNPKVRVLIFTTPHKIGAKADPLIQEMRSRQGVHLDVRDQSWFVERENKSDATTKAAGWFSDYVIGKLTHDETLIDHSASILGDEESRSALVFLVLQRKDDTLDRQLTKQCFDALVRSVLRDTDNENRKTRSAIHDDLLSIVPSQHPEEVLQYADLALTRLTKRYVRHWTKTDEFCLTYEERERVAEQRAQLHLADAEFESELHKEAHFVAEPLGLDISVVDLEALTVRFRRVLERLLFQRGESFVNSVTTGEDFAFREEEIEVIATDDLAHHPDKSSLRGGLIPLITQTLTRTLLDPTDEIRAYLRGVADAYTLWAFLRETPNVQSAVSKLFSQGDLWLDTSAVLPLLAEELLEGEERGYTTLIDAARQAGAKVMVTQGVVEELVAHISLCIRASRSPGTWNSRTPFLLAAYIWGGGRNEDFLRWVNNFSGKHRPADDLIEYLEEANGIVLEDLQSEYDGAADEIRWQSDEYWQAVHQKRRDADTEHPSDPVIIRELANHDSVAFVGVLERRKSEPLGPFGYKSWWLTLDSAARRASKEISRMVDRPIDSPVLGFEFLTNYLVVGPARRQLTKSQIQHLPVLNDTSLVEGTPEALLAAADDARRRFEGQSERVIRREIRDHLDQEKLRGGRVGQTTVEAMEQDIRMALESEKAG